MKLEWLAYGAVLLSVGCGTPWSEEDPATWAAVDMGPFSMTLPPDFDEHPVDGIDSLVRRYQASDEAAYVSVDFGWYSSDLAPEPGQYLEYVDSVESIDGRDAQVVVGALSDVSRLDYDGAHVAAATWQDVFPEETGMPTKLTIFIQMRDQRLTPIMLNLLRSVVFGPR